jgi:SAM-dependent methyltransferase
VNQGHAQLCSSTRWADFIAADVLPVAMADLELGKRVLEIGPGYGAATAVLSTMECELTAVEVDPLLAARLRERFPAVRVVEGRGEDLPFPDGSFTAVFSFTMLHHVHSVEAQDELFAQAYRVLRDGGSFAGSDSIASPGLRSFHHDDIYTPVDPHTLAERLHQAGFTGVDIRVAAEDEWFSFSARRQ